MTMTSVSVVHRRRMAALQNSQENKLSSKQLITAALVELKESDPSEKYNRHPPTLNVVAAKLTSAIWR